MISRSVAILALLPKPTPTKMASLSSHWTEQTTTTTDPIATTTTTMTTTVESQHRHRPQHPPPSAEMSIWIVTLICEMLF